MIVELPLEEQLSLEKQARSFNKTSDWTDH